MASKSEVQARVVEHINNIYEPELLNTYHREIGAKEYQWYTINPITANQLNNADRQIRFNDTLKERHYKLKSMGILYTFQLVRNDNGTNFTAAVTNGICCDSWFDEVRIKIGNSDINSGYGSKTSLNKGAHLLKIIQYSKPYAQMIADSELFFPDSGSSSSAETRKYSLNVRVAKLSDGGVVADSGAVGVNNNNVIIVGVQGGTGAQFGADVDIFASAVTAYPNAFAERYVYNEGQAKMAARLAASNIYTVWIPLIHYAPSLNAFPDVLTGFVLDVVIRKTLDAELCFYGTDFNAVSAPKLNVIDAKLQVEMYTPDATGESIFKNRLIDAYTDVRKYIDLDIFQYPTLITGTTTRADFTAVLDRKAVAVMFAYQFPNDYQTISGNTNRYVNPYITDAYLQVGNGQRIPRDSYVGSNSTNQNYLEFWRSMTKVCDVVGNQHSMVLDYQSFANHKFFVAFDLREIDPTNFNLGGALKLSFNATHTACPANTAAYYDGFGIQGSGTGATTGSPPGSGTGYQLWMFLFIERSVRVSQTATGTTVESNYFDNN